MEFREKQNIDVRVLHEVTAIDTKARRVEVHRVDADNAPWWEPFDQLLIATGAVPICPNVPGAGAEGIFGVHTLQSGIRVRRFIDERRPKRAVIVGGGYIGLEMAEALLLRGIETAVVERAEQVMGTLDPDMGSLVSQSLRNQGAGLYLEESLEAFETAGGSVVAVVTDKRRLGADLVILGMGVRPNTGLASDAGIPLGERGAVRVDRRMETAVNGIWAAGDCAESFHVVTQKPFYVALGTVANRHGRVAGANMAGGNETFNGVVGTAVTKICAVEVARTGLMEKEIQAVGWDYVTERIESRTRAGYYPGAGTIFVKLIGEKGSRRLLGGQIVGCEGAAKRIDIVATALHAGLTVDQVEDLDLSYAPPFSPLWDPVIIAARELKKKL
nr:FAD-dependent oxidoreductase [Desulfoglaeba alkanexedens]